MSNLSTLPNGDSAWLLRKAIERIIQQISVLETNIGSSTTGNSSNTQVIFNDNGVLRGDSDLTFNTALNKLVATALESTTSLVVGTTATITGDLTVRTNKLAVTSTGVGIGTASPAAPLHIQVPGTDSAAIRLAAAGGRTYDINSTAAGYGSANNLIIYDITGSAERWRLDATGNHFWNNVGGVAGTAMTLNSTGLGVGESPVSGQKLTVNGAGSIRNANRFNLWDSGNATAHGIYNSGDNLTFFKNNGTTSMTLDASGNLLVGTTSAGGNRLNVQTASGDCTMLIKSTAASTNAALTIDYVNTYGNINFAKSGTSKWSIGILNDSTSTPTFKVFNDAAAGVYVTYGATSWTGTSDERLKDIIEPISNAVAKVGSLRSVIGKFKTDSEGTRRSFLIAQDVQSVLPEAVDASNPDRLGVAYTDVIPLLVAAIKELTTRVQTLEAR
jgi:hypothetical protein